MSKNAPHIGEAVVKRGLAKVGKSHTPGMCQKEIRQLFGVPSSGDYDKDGDADATDAWKSAAAKGKVVKDRKVANAPRGAYLYFSGGKHGHVALGLGGDSCVSTDAGGSGRWAKAKISALEKRWNRQYEGYIVVTGHGYRVFQEPAEVKGTKTSPVRYQVTATKLNARSGPGTNYSITNTRDKGFEFTSSEKHGKWRKASTYWYHEDYLKKVAVPEPVEPEVTRFEVTATRLNARSGPGVNHPVKAVRDKGFQFNSSKQSGDWVQASTYWYHKDYLKVAGSKPPAPAPKPKSVGLRVGSMNIPLDAEKIADGAKRVKVAAKQINDSDLDVVALQELDRSPKAMSHVYADQLLKALGSGWDVVKPSTLWNENYLFYRPKQVSLVKALPDLILPSSAGGRHATRARFKKDGAEFTVYSTHLVSGSGNGKAREAQGNTLGQNIDSLTLVLGDLNQKALPVVMAKTHKTARDHADVTTAAAWGTYAKYSATKASKVETAFLDHLVVPKDAIVKGYTVVGVGEDGVLSQPRASDHLLIIASIVLPV